jgi:hypothetical protein
LAEGPAQKSFESVGQVQEELLSNDLAFAEPDTITETAPKKTQPIASATPARAKSNDAEIGEKIPAASPAKAREEAADKSDDFTTDTLAELYIAQGFYEKAIEIYERMLVDKPNSRGLKDKLDRVRSMATASAAAAVSTVSTKEEKTEANIFAEQAEYAPAAERSEWPPAGRDEKTENFASPPAQEFKRERPVYTDFEPREYVPPKAEPVETKETKTEHEETKMEKVHAVPKTSTASRKETIDRLESWLRNIMKEK